MRRVIRLMFLGVVLALTFLWLSGSYLTRPAHRTAPPIPTDFPLEPFYQSGVAGWISANTNTNDLANAKKCVLLMHGVRAMRTSMLGRARFLTAAGYRVLLIDLLAHGESEGEQITFGWRESQSARDAVDYLKRREGCARIAAIGVSLGGAASLLGEAPLPVDALVLEAVFPDITSAVTNRLTLRLGPVGEWIAPLLYWQIPLRLGVPLTSLNPASAIAGLKAPLLLVAGSDDRRTTVQESRALFAAAPSPKSLWILEGARHEDFHRFAPNEYENRVLKFFAEHLAL